MGKDKQVDITSEDVEKDKLQANLNRVWTLAKEGKSVEEIRETLELKEVGVVKNALVQLMAEKGENLSIDGLDRASIHPTYTATGIRLDPAMLEGSGFKPGDAFDMKVTKDGIKLKRR